MLLATPSGVGHAIQHPRMPDTCHSVPLHKRSSSRECSEVDSWTAHGQRRDVRCSAPHSSQLPPQLHLSRKERAHDEMKATPLMRCAENGRRRGENNQIPFRKGAAMDHSMPKAIRPFSPFASARAFCTEEQAEHMLWAEEAAAILVFARRLSGRLEAEACAAAWAAHQ